MPQSYTVPFLMSAVIGFIMGLGVMYYLGEVPIGLTTTTATAVVSVPYPVTTTHRETLTVTTRTTLIYTTPVTTTLTATVTNTTTKTLERTSTVTTTLTTTSVQNVTVTTSITTTRTATSTVTVATTLTTTVTTTTTTTTTVRPEIAVCFSAPMNCASIIADLIRRANSSVYVAVYIFTNPTLADALVDAHRRGVRVIVVVEQSNENATGSQVAYLRGQGIDVVLDNNTYLMHHKFVIIDSEYVVTGSYNWTLSAEDRNDENVIIIRDREIAQLYEEEFRRILLEAGYV